MSTRMRQYILDVAGDMFARQGINATSVDKIVAQAQIAKVTLYKYFTSKEVLIVEYLRNHNAQLWSRLESSPKPDDAMVALQDYVHSVFDMIGEKEFKGFASINAAVEFPESDSIVNQTSKEFSRTLRSKLSELAENAGVKNPETLAMQLQLVIEGASISDPEHRSNHTVDHAKSMADILINSSKP